MLIDRALIVRRINGFVLSVLSAESDARAQVSWQSHGTGSSVLHEANGNRCGLHSLAKSRTPRSQAWQHVSVGRYGRKDRRLWLGNETGRSAPTRVSSLLQTCRTCYLFLFYLLNNRVQNH